MQDAQLFPHQQASKAYASHLTAIILNVILQLLMRVAAFSPMLCAGISGKFFGVKPDHVMIAALLASIPLYLLIVMPFRYHFFAKMSGFLGYARKDEASNYGKWLAAGLYRIVRSLPFILPIIAYAGLYYYYMRIADLTKLPLLILSLGNIVGGSFSEGTAILVVIGFLAFFVALIGWRRSILFESQPIVEIGISASWKKSRMLRSRAQHTSLINFLLCLPGLLAMGAVMAINVAQVLSGSIFE